jgi:hypothetical protein
MNKKISDLAAASSLTGVEYFEVLQGGVNKKVPATDLVIGLAVASASTASSTITLTFGSGIAAFERRFIGSASFATPKTIALASDTNANHFTFLFEITDVAATLTFPADFKSSDTRFSSLVFTSLETGIFKATADYDGNSWYIDFSPLPYV